MSTHLRINQHLVHLTAATMLLLLVGCRAAPIAPIEGVATAAPAATETPSLSVTMTQIAALAPDQALPPTQLEIPALGLELPVVEMTWEIATVDGEHATKWVVPEDAVGWHVDSTGAGAAGNTVLSAHQAKGDALFAPLAAGDVVVGQELVLTDSEGVAFVYRVTTVSEPIPINGATADEEAAVAAFLAPNNSGTLTLITGWPSFATTHRIFAQADYVGVAK